MTGFQVFFYEGKMNNSNLIQELDLILKQKNLTPEQASHYIGCSFKQIYRWLQGVSTPSLIYRKAIQRGIKRMRGLASINMGGIFEDRDLYKKISKFITLKEKAWLLGVDGDYSAYHERLKKLAIKYKI